MEELLYITTSDNDFERFKSDLYIHEVKEKPIERDDDLILRDANGRRVRSPSPSPERRIFLKR